jgi:hypothetical protein
MLLDASYYNFCRLTDSHEIAFSQTGHQFKSHIIEQINKYTQRKSIKKERTREKIKCKCLFIYHYIKFFYWI